MLSKARKGKRGFLQIPILRDTFQHLRLLSIALRIAAKKLPEELWLPRKPSVPFFKATVAAFRDKVDGN